MKAYLCGHFHCHECRKHCVESTMEPMPSGDPGYGFNVFWCENPECANYHKTFVVRAPVVEVEPVPVEIVEMVH